MPAGLELESSSPHGDASVSAARQADASESIAELSFLVHCLYFAV